MRVLVIDDSPINMRAAREQLSDHETVIAGAYDQGLAELLRNLGRIKN